MISIKVDSAQLQAMLKQMPKQTRRALEQTLDYTAARMADAVRTQILRVFDRPTQYTINGVMVTKTRNHNMRASVWLRHPPRMSASYLTPQVDGGGRKLKGFERALGQDKFMPGESASMDNHGNVKTSQIKAVLKAARSGSSKLYVYLPKGSKKGQLPPGVYQRFKYTVHGYENGKRRRATLARGLRPILIKSSAGRSVRPLLPFYAIARAEYLIRFAPAFHARFRALVQR